MTSQTPPLILFLTTLLTLITPSFQTQFLPLTHSLSTSSFTSQHHLLKTTTTLSKTRHDNRQKKRQQQVSLPLSPGSDYTLTFTVNSQTLPLYMDTGSDVVWFPCSPFECILCDGKYPPGNLNLLNLSNPSSSRVSCKTNACSAAHSSISTSDLCVMANCPLEEVETSDCSGFACPAFYYAYGDGSFVAKLHQEDLIMPSNNNKNSLVLKDFKFGCANTVLAEPIGVAGFGRGLLSLPAQLADISPELGSQFSYCLVSHSFDSTKLRHPSPLILGKHKYKADDDSLIESSSFVYTPLLDNPKHPYFYSVGLEGISVGSRRIDSPHRLKRVDSRGDGGIVVDSGTTYTMMPTGFYNTVANELDRRVGKVFTRDRETEAQTGLSPCYELDSKKGSVGLVVPSMVLHFGGNSSVRLPRKNYFYELTDGENGKKNGKKVGCFMMMDGGDDSEIGPGLTLGNYQQQGFEVVYDLKEKRVGFARRKCASLWADLNQN